MRVMAKTIHRRARRLKKAYRDQWYISNQKERFVELFFRSLGFNIHRAGLGVSTMQLINDVGSKPDYVVRDRQGGVLFYVEVTGANRNYKPGMDIYVCYSKFTKYYSLARETPILFVFLGFCEGKLTFAGYAWYEDLYPYSEDRKNIVVMEPYGVREYYIRTPFTLWRPLHMLARELRGLA